jgi:Cobalamin-5-phosphate synthase
MTPIFGSSNMNMGFKPIGHSQYVEDSKEPGRWKYRLGIVVQLCAFIGIIAFFMFRWNLEELAVLGAVLGVEIVVSFLANLFARHQLGGMSGDIAGYCICISEFAGVLALALI